MAMKRVTYADVVDVRRVFDEVQDAFIEMVLEAASDTADAYLALSCVTPLVEWGAVVRRDVARIAAADILKTLEVAAFDSLRAVGPQDWRAGLTTRTRNAIERCLGSVSKVEIADLRRITPRRWASVKGVGQGVYGELRRLVGDPTWPERRPTPQWRRP